MEGDGGPEQAATTTPRIRCSTSSPASTRAALRAGGRPWVHHHRGASVRSADGRVLASSGLMNPQIRFGEDLMSRVSYAMMNPGGDVEMTRAVREAIDIWRNPIARRGRDRPGAIYEMVIVCNPVMHHLLLGIDPVELGQAPFALATGAVARAGCARPWTCRQPEPQCAGLCPALHRRPCRRRLRRRGAVRGTEQIQGHGADRRCRHQCRILLGNRPACWPVPRPPARPSRARRSAGQRAAPGAIERVEIDP
jgi:hypothetical protein